ncbi:MAG: metal ABC transporter permease [Chitinispirillaceae bacterium]|nr:metal ABC transporter permease [Chitinispirillaceae bacterium]
MIDLMVLPFCATLLLTGMFAYLGIHIIQRQVIFVDLALAQIAAFGTMVGLLFGVGLHTKGSFLFALPFTLAGAAVFALTRLRGRAVPQEAVIGIVYVVTTAASILLLNSSPSAAEHIKHMLVGNILFVHWSDVGYLAVLCVGIGLFHFIFSKRFLAISRDPDASGFSAAALRWWDFLFYVSLGLCVTAAVEMAGVLLIFSYLVVPAACSMLLAGSLRRRLVLGWSIGALASVCGLFCSARFDLPTGAAIVCSFGAFFAAALGISLVTRKQNASRTSGPC